MYLPWCWSGGSEIWVGTRYFSALWSMNDFFTALLREFFYHGFALESTSSSIYPIGEVWVSKVQSFSRQVGLAIFSSIFLFFWVRSYSQQKKYHSFVLAPYLAWALFGIVWFSPVQNPWYWMWGLPFFLLTHHTMAIWLVALSPAYLFNFCFDASSHLFHPFQWWVIVPHVMVLMLGWMRLKRTLMSS
jgi:hypothetical protein